MDQLPPKAATPGRVAEELDGMATAQGRIHGQLVSALVLRRISPRLLDEQAARMEEQAARMKGLARSLRKEDRR